ncbi:c-type cytochrome [Benzoatithermus flavus]|uniref:C-type cytochrome n=1 Tax=Benzoatithermus flavus TaxID=3108223 RepID=A0ABU8XUN4_9PROT
MRIGWKHLVGFAILLALGGFLVAWSGLVSVAASSGHWPPVAWFLHFTMRQAVDTQSMGIEPPAGLDDPHRVALGAAHFASGCAPCHGAPGEPQSPIALEMTPHPPSLPPKIPSWEPRHLFWIVQHGVKFSGMPAWATQARPDEVWSVVAFLLRLPELDAVGYRHLAYGLEAAGSADAGEAGLADLGEGPIALVLANCARCHGRDGADTAGAGIPLIGGQNEPYLAATLRAYAERHRASGIMQPLARALDDEAIARLARHYASRSRPTQHDRPPAEQGLLRHGETLARSGRPEQGIPPCTSCHGPPARYPHYPEIAGQDAGYIERQLELFRSGTRGGTPFAHLMLGFASRLTEADIRAAAAFYARMPPGTRVSEDEPRPMTPATAFAPSGTSAILPPRP